MGSEKKQTPWVVKLRTLILLLGLGLIFVNAGNGYIVAQDVDRVSVSPSRLKVICYNVFNGFQNGESLDVGADWIESKNPDIVGLQELVGWDAQRLRKVAIAWEHPFGVTLKDGGYNIGLTSRYPIEVVERVTKGFHHGYLHARTGGMDVIVTHLWPGTRSQQIREAAAVRDLVSQLSGQGREVILMGDFNAHASKDGPWLAQQLPLLDRRRPNDEKNKPSERFIVDGHFTFDVMATVFDAPVHDIIRERFDMAQPDATYDDWLKLGSFPTKVLSHSKTAESQRGFLERIDFLLVTKGLARSCTMAKVCRDDVGLERISDHYPLLAEFELGTTEDDKE